MVSSEDAVKFKNWMRTDQEQFEMSRPYYKTYYDYDFEFLKDRSFYASFLFLAFFGTYAYKRYDIESQRAHRAERANIESLPAHHFNNRGGVVLKKEFIGFGRYFKDEADQMQWLHQAYPSIYNEGSK